MLLEDCKNEIARLRFSITVKFTNSEWRGMSRKVALTLLVAVLVALAGCGGNVNQTTTASPNDTTTASPGGGTSTPTNTATNSKSLSSITLPKGISQSSVEETQLLATHKEALKASSFTKNIRVAIATGANLKDPRVVTSTHTARVNPSNGNALALSQSGNGQSKEMYSSGSMAYIKTTQDGNAQYAASSRMLSVNEIVAPYLVKPYLDAAAYTPEKAVTKNGRTLIQLRVTGIENPQIIRDQMQAKSVSNASGTALVDTTGRIHNLDLTIQFTPEQANVTNEIRVSMNLKNVGSTSIKKPSWVSQAKKTALATDIALVNGQYVKVTPTNGNLKAGTEFYVFLKGQGDSKVTVSEEITSGESVYIYAQGGEIKFSTSEPSSAQKIGGYSLVAVGPNGNELFRSSG